MPRNQKRERPWGKDDDIPMLTAADLVGASELQREYLYVTLQILQNYTGCSSPFEELVRELIMDYAYGEPDAEVVNREVEQFHQNFADMKRDTANFLKLYPHLVPKSEKAPQGVETTRGARNLRDSFEDALRSIESMVDQTRSLYADRLMESGVNKLRQAELIGDLRAGLDQARALGHRLSKIDLDQTTRSVEARQEIIENVRDLAREREADAPLSFTGPPFPHQMEELTPEARA